MWRFRQLRFALSRCFTIPGKTILDILKQACQTGGPITVYTRVELKNISPKICPKFKLLILLYNSPNYHKTHEQSITTCFIPKKFDPRISWNDKILSKICPNFSTYTRVYTVFVYIMQACQTGDPITCLMLPSAILTSCKIA